MIRRAPVALPRGEAGFTLVELLFAVLVLLIGLLALVSTLGYASRYQALSSGRSEMTLLADAKFEQLRTAASAGNADTLQLAVGGSVSTPTGNWTDNIVGPSGRGYRRMWAVSAGPVNTLVVDLRIVPQVNDPRVPARLDFATMILRR